MDGDGKGYVLGYGDGVFWILINSLNQFCPKIWKFEEKNSLISVEPSDYNVCLQNVSCRFVCMTK